MRTNHEFRKPTSSTGAPAAATRRPWHRVAATVALAAALTLPAACSDDAGASDAGVVEVTLIDFAFEGLPDSVPVGTTLTVSNESEHELHELVAFRLPDDETRSVDDLVRLPPEQLMPLLGEPTTVLLAAPDGEMIPAVGDGTLTEPGRYAILCAIPTGADIGEYRTAAAVGDGPPQVDGGPPHLAHGMYAEVVVE